MNPVDEQRQKITLSIPSALVMTLKSLARRHWRTLNGEAIWALQDYVAQQQTAGEPTPIEANVGALDHPGTEQD